MVFQILLVGFEKKIGWELGFCLTHNWELGFEPLHDPQPLQSSTKGPAHRPNAVTQRNAICLFLKVNKTANGKKFCKICISNSLNC